MGLSPRMGLPRAESEALYMVDCLEECLGFWKEIGNGWGDWLAKVNEVERAREECREDNWEVESELVSQRRRRSERSG